MLPLFFQVILLESASKAGARLAIPSLATPLGGLLAGVVMSRWGFLIPLVRTGAVFMTIGNALTATLGFSDPWWKYFVYIFPANLGQGIIFPSILFTSLATFEHAGQLPFASLLSITARWLTPAADHAVSASTVYLVRSLGTVWGVSITSAILQTTLSVRLPEALGDVTDKWRVRPVSLQSCFSRYVCSPTLQVADFWRVFFTTLCRLSMTFDTRLIRCAPSSQRFRKRSSSSTMTASGTRLRRRLLPRPSWCARRCWRARLICARRIRLTPRLARIIPQHSRATIYDGNFWDILHSICYIERSYHHIDYMSRLYSHIKNTTSASLAFGQRQSPWLLTVPS